MSQPLYYHCDQCATKLPAEGPRPAVLLCPDCELLAAHPPQEIRNLNALAALERAMAVLTASERGRDVLADLYRLLNGRASGLGSREWAAVLALVDVYRDGWPGSVLDALRPAAIDKQ
jgi:hypothetical protein